MAQVAKRDSRIERIAFLRQRQSGIGSSDIAALFGVDPYGRTEADVFDEKVGEIDPDYTSPALERGRWLEDIVARLFMEKTGRKVRRMRTKRHPDHPYIIASCDREQILPGRWPLEIKNPGVHNFLKYQRYGMHPGLGLQLQQQLEVTGRPKGTFAFFNAEVWRLIHFDMDRDETIGRQIVDRCNHFWHDHVLAGVRPTVQAVPLPELPEPKGDITLRKDEAFLAAVDAHREAEAIHAQSKELVEMGKAKVKELMGGKGIHEGGGRRYYWTERPGRKTLQKKQIAALSPLDAIKLAVILKHRGLPIEDIKEMFRDSAIDLDAPPVEKHGKPYEHFQGYDLKQTTPHIVE